VVAPVRETIAQKVALLVVWAGLLLGLFFVLVPDRPKLDEAAATRPHAPWPLSTSSPSDWAGNSWNRVHHVWHTQPQPGGGGRSRGGHR
jgi:hypothetical protein